MTERGSAASDQIGLEMGSPPSAFGISPARGAKGTHDSSLPPPCGGRCHGVTEGGPPPATRAPLGLEMGSPPSAFGISPARGAKGTHDSSLPPLRGEMSRSDRGGVRRQRPDRPCDGEPPSAFGISPARGAKGTYSRGSRRDEHARRGGRGDADRELGAGKYILSWKRVQIELTVPADARVSLSWRDRRRRARRS